jgi:hypothetical protein
MRWGEVWTKAQAWGCPCHPKKYPIDTSVNAWGCPRGTPSSAKIRSPFKTLYFYCFIFYAFFLERLYFYFQFSSVLFAAINGWITSCLFWRETYSIFHLPRTLYLSLLSFNGCFLFLELRLAFVFRLDSCADLVISLHQGAFRPLVYVGFHQNSCFKKVWMVLKKRKKFHDYSGTNGSLFRLRLRLLHGMLDVILIVCLVVFAVAWLVSND